MILSVDTTAPGTTIDFPTNGGNSLTSTDNPNGAIFLFDPSGADIDLSIAWPLILAAAGTSALIMIGLLGFVVRERRREVVTGSEELLNLEGEVVSWDAGEGRVRVHGESWAARSDSDLAKGEKVRVAGREGLTLIVAKP